MTAALCVVACSYDEDDVLVTETLPTPGSVSYTADTNSLHFEWGAVGNAASYEATLAPSSSSSSTETVSTTNTQCDFDGLTEGTSYVFTLTNSGNKKTTYQDRINPGSSAKFNQSFFDNYLHGILVEDFTVDNTRLWLRVLTLPPVLRYIQLLWMIIATSYVDGQCQDKCIY